MKNIHIELMPALTDLFQLMATDNDAERWIPFIDTHLSTLIDKLKIVKEDE